ncbi:hypothetical protein KCU64_g16103, partial [Aureobasidium melanogenum]
MNLGIWGKVGTCPERPIKKSHLNKLLKYMDLEPVKENQKAVSNSPAPPLVPLYEEEVRRHNLKLDTHNLLIANSGLESNEPTNGGSSEGCAETVVPPNHGSTTSATETAWQINDGERPAADLTTDTDDCPRGSSCVPATTPPAMETVSMDSVAASDTSPSITDSEGGVEFTPFEEQRTGFEPESRENDKSASQFRDSWYPKEGDRGMQDAVVAEDRDRQADLLAKIAEASCLSNSRHGPTTEEMCSSLFAEHIARAIEIVKETLTARPCKCEDTLTMQMQEDVFSRFYNDLSSQQAEVGRKLELEISRVRQEMSDRLLCDQKEIVGAIEARIERYLEKSFDATIKRLDSVEEQLRDRFARAGLGIVDELKSVQKMGMEVTNKLSRKWRQNSAEIAQSQMRNVEKLKSDILGRFSNMQKHAMRLEQEVRDLRRAFISPNMRDEAESQMQADIKEGISQMQQILIKHTQMQQTLIEHMRMQLGMNEKTQAFQDQQVINLTGVKSQVDVMVSKLPVSEEAVTSLKQAAQYLHEIGEKLGKLKDDPEITEIPLDPQDNRADFVESDGPCGTRERFRRAVDVPEALDGTGYVASTPAHETQFRNFGGSRRDDLTLDKSNCSGYSIPSASWPERGSGSSQTQGGHGIDELRQSENERKLDSIAEPERQIESSENHLVQSDTASPAAHCGQTATSFPTQRPASHPQVSTHRQNIAQSPLKTYQGFQMSATDVPTKERSPEQPSSLPPERRCGEKRPREEDTVGHQGIKMKAPRLTV